MFESIRIFLTAGVNVPSERLFASVWTNTHLPCLPIWSRNTRQSYSAALLSIASVGLTLVADTNTDFDEQIPGALMAATNYSAKNGVINYMYRQVPNVAPKVTTTPLSDFYDKLRVNYYGRTQTAGQQIDFYQRGVVMGGATAPTDMNVHANEQWLKDVCAAALLTAQLSLGRISANRTGRGTIITTLQEPIDAALYNGVISVDKPLKTIQKLYITQMTGDDNAWQQVQGIGYWLDAYMESFVTPDGRTEWQCVYTLIYSKDDAIRRVQGMGLNGDLVHWSTAQPLVITLNVIPNSDDDKNLYVLAEANRVAKGKTSARDKITIALTYASGEVRTLSNGVITDAILGNGVASAGRMKTKAYIQTCRSLMPEPSVMKPNACWLLVAILVKRRSQRNRLRR
ncbi:DUF3383 family protein [Serratia sp. 3ACOL1]|nr:DUF3383 family protein [Serratia sp. 3ACOL1]